jgi:hypothetical protein
MLLWKRIEPATSFLAHQSGTKDSSRASTAGETVMFHCSALYKFNLLWQIFEVKVSLSFSFWLILIPQHFNWLHFIVFYIKSIRKHSFDTNILLQTYEKFHYYIRLHVSVYMGSSNPCYWNMDVVCDLEHTVVYYGYRQCAAIIQHAVLWL